MSRLPHRGTLLLALLLLLATVSTTPVTARNAISTPVSQRIALMSAQKAAMEVLTGMTTGRTGFDRRKARNARRQLIRSTAAIPRRFRKQHLDPASHARPTIWPSWQDFKIRATRAEKAARALNTRSLTGLRRTLPTLMQSCLSCHQTYRETPNRFITH
ncbi:c-type cytochrome [Leisingera sp.]|uniref:c-type cytochrome n=1 Tax=Leisingera sp. TaxID=1879318 RepID=UPI003A8D4A04